MSDDRELCVGRHVGFDGRGDAFRKAKMGLSSSLLDWRHCAWLVERKGLEASVIDDHALILPEVLLDPDVMASARRWLARQPLLCVSGAKARRLVEAGVRVYRVEHGVEGDDVLVVEALGGEHGSWRLRVDLATFTPRGMRLDEASLLHQAPAEARVFVDRILDRLSRGVLREASVCNALAARLLVEPGYGYHGATDGVAARIEVVQRGLLGLDALFAQVDERAAGQRKAALEAGRAVRGAPEDVNEIEVPVYGSASRRRLPEVILPVDGEGQYLVNGKPRDEIVLPERARWMVERVDAWSPELPPDVERRLAEGSARFWVRPWMAVALAAVLVGIVLVGLLVAGR